MFLSQFIVVYRGPSPPSIATCQLSDRRASFGCGCFMLVKVLVVVTMHDKEIRKLFSMQIAFNRI